MGHLAIIGCGYVGAVSAVCFAELGHTVDCIDIDRSRIERLRAGKSPIHEPGLETLLRSGLDSGRLRFHDSYPAALDAGIAFIAVNTPGSAEGAADLRSVRDAVATVAPLLPANAIIVNKSTVPIGTGELVEGMASRAGRPDISVVSNPEFLREGNAVRDFMAPDRIVLGSASAKALDRVEVLYASLDAPVLKVDIRTAEMIKYASNAFLATKISFINEMAAICEALGADVVSVAEGMGLDERIGSRFLNAGLGWGGSCFPKDVRALAHTASIHGTTPQLLRSVIDINNQQRLRMVAKLRGALGTLEGATIALLGAAFKANTDDTRNSPALELANLLALEGANVRVHDPIVPDAFIELSAPLCAIVASVEDACRGADATVVATEWPQFAAIDWRGIRRAMRGNVVLDTRNFLDSTLVQTAGLTYLGVGRPGLETALPVEDLAIAGGGAS